MTNGDIQFKDVEPDFQDFPKMARLARDCIVTEKIDGTNAQIFIRPGFAGTPNAVATWFDAESATDMVMFAGSRSRLITPDDDNFGFAAWVHANAEDLKKLGAGRHFGEWWGAGIQRRYGLDEKRFSLFNTSRWHDADGVAAGEGLDGRTYAPSSCHVVPLLLGGLFKTEAIDACLDLLRERGSYAAPGFMKPEGVVVYHIAAGTGFKKTLEKDEVPKAVAQQQANAAKGVK
jgi:hypothetical protein